MDWLGDLDAYWAWLSIGLLLAIMEMLVPGVYLIWLALAALATGALTYVLDLGVPLQIVNFVFLSLIIVFSARRMVRDNPIESTDPLLNNRMGRLVGQSATVTVAISDGDGRVRQGDSEWLARGPDMESGGRVRIIGFEGGTLLVEPLTRLEDKRDGPAEEGAPA